MKQRFRRIREVPVYGWIAGVFYFLLQRWMYTLTNHVSHWLGTAEHAILPKIPVIDDRIPVVAVFAVIYLYSFIFWILGPVIASLTGKRNFVNFLISMTAAYIVGAVIFVAMPTYMDRAAEGLLEISEQPGIMNRLLYMIYSNDGWDRAYNLFPSYHCLISFCCYLGIRRREEVSFGVRAYSLIMAVLICLSTVFTKQHYVLDVIGGSAIAILCHVIVQKLDPAGRIFGKETPAK